MLKKTVISTLLILTPTLLIASEKNIHSQEYAGQKLQSKGYLDDETVGDFPLRDKACFLKIKRRKHVNENTRKVVYRNWELVANGT